MALDGIWLQGSLSNCAMHVEAHRVGDEGMNGGVSGVESPASSGESKSAACGRWFMLSMGAAKGNLSLSLSVEERKWRFQPWIMRPLS